MTKRENNPYEAQVADLVRFFDNRTDLPKGKFGCVVITDPNKLVQTQIQRINNSPYPSKVYLAATRLLNWYRNIINNGTK